MADLKKQKHLVRARVGGRRTLCSRARVGARGATRTGHGQRPHSHAAPLAAKQGGGQALWRPGQAGVAKPPPTSQRSLNSCRRGQLVVGLEAQFMCARLASSGRQGPRQGP